jgi:uncharacterized protein YeaO (DUF488 family)
MTKILTKRVYDTPTEHDGTRILVDRLWPRGVSKESAALALWAKDVAPSAELRKWFDHQADRFPEFRRRYLDELAAITDWPEELTKEGRGTITLLFSAKDPDLNQAAVLAEFLKGRR